jgi:cobaltochelatase CobN
VMLETARKGYWKASAQQLKDVAQLHTQLVKDHKAACSEFVCDNAKLRSFIAENVSQQQASDYSAGISAARDANVGNGKAMVLKKEQQTSNASSTDEATSSNTYVWWIVGIALLLAVLVIARLRNKKN